MHQESEIKSSKKRKNDENCGPSSVATENVSKAFRSKQGRSLLGSNSSNCQVKWDMPKEKAEKLYQELGVSELPPISPSKCVDVGPETPKSMRNTKKRESGYYSRGSITPVFSNIMTTGLTPPFSSLDLNILRQNRTPRSSNSLNSLEKPVEVPHFEKLSDEMTLKIFGFLSKKVLAWRCSLVNRKWNKLA
ncbi:hypothetical protein HDE_12804 [Halotydeus destructor]|nr:hypothetical protein HDE_12804 [Halotydeus destructor]